VCSIASSQRTKEEKLFLAFCSELERPDGEGKLVLEGFQRLITHFVFSKGRVELLVLLPKGNGKTTLFAALSVYHLLTTQNAECFIGAADKEQADEMYRFAAHFCEHHPQIRKHTTVRRSTREIRSKRDQGFIRVLASDQSKGGGKRHSFNPTLALIDELHAHDNDNLYVALRSATFKRGGMVLTISTAGHDFDTVLGRLRIAFNEIDQQGGTVVEGLKEDDHGRLHISDEGRLRVAISASGNSAMLEWALEEDEDWQNDQVVKEVNPASFVTLGSIKDAREAPGITPWHFARYRCNIWTLGEEYWLPQGAWEACGDDFDPEKLVPEGADVIAAVDMARYQDYAAITCVYPETNPQVIPADQCTGKVWLHAVWKGDPYSPVPYSDVKKEIRDLSNRYRVIVGYDPRYFDQAAEELEAEGIDMAIFNQSNERMSAASMNLYRAITEGRLSHPEDDTLTRHVRAGARKDINADVWRLIKRKGRGPAIDALIALAMAWQLCFYVPLLDDPFVEII
jgi:phage terminase large subunit-like protein